MPLLHCTKCQHEWESIESEGVCDWCGEESYVLAEKANIEKMNLDEASYKLSTKLYFIKFLTEMKFFPQRQDSLLDQLYDLITIGSKLGLYDACDYIKKSINKDKLKG